MALNFPNSPSLNDIHNENGTRWQWNGESWTRIETAGSQGFQGATGSTGSTGPTGAQGASGAAVGGTANQVVYKNNSNVTTGSSNLTFDGTNLTCGGTVTANSDLNLKKNISTIQNAVDKVTNLRGVEFDYIENNQHSIGFIAQEVENVIPELVFGNDPKSVAYQNVVALLVEAVKEQNDIINNLKKRVENLENNN